MHWWGGGNAEEDLFEVIFTVNFLGKRSLGENGAKTYWRKGSRTDRSSDAPADYSEQINTLPESSFVSQASGTRWQLPGKTPVRVKLLSEPGDWVKENHTPQNQTA